MQTRTLTRRCFLFSSFSSLIFLKKSLASPSDWSSLHRSLAQLDLSTGGRLGVAILDTSNNNSAGLRSQERFPMCSTFKLLAVGAVLARVDQQKEQLDRMVHFAQSDLVTYSPATEKRIEGMSVRALCEAAITLSDNTAANLLLASLGGPAGVTSFARTLGDQFTRLDRNEPDLNEALPGDPRDTTTPESMVSNLRALVLGDALSPGSRAQLTEWLVDCKTGDKRLRAGLPSTWKVGDKTGSGKQGTTNDVAVLWPPRKPPILVAAYLTGTTLDDDHRNAILASVGKLVASAVAQ
jgi:beta-lactamase class A